ncbi:hypothetical protein [Jiella avicenniae]|uniref:Uncharacterized protein n=1 Tax=Jiella avicenniae TaxID=2907202 RepID=A0A9X1P4D6_9HYPH|nr:hypothetical protein [Jiella avicenniae]MCE7029061.1 hypothetical protein [Jiella avicenniae]
MQIGDEFGDDFRGRNVVFEVLTSDFKNNLKLSCRLAKFSIPGGVDCIKGMSVEKLVCNEAVFVDIDQGPGCGHGGSPKRQRAID